MIHIIFRAGSNTVSVVPNKYALVTRQCVPWHIVSTDPDITKVEIAFAAGQNFFGGHLKFPHKCERTLDYRPSGTLAETVIYGHAPLHNGSTAERCKYTVTGFRIGEGTVVEDPMIIVTEND